MNENEKFQRGREVCCAVKYLATIVNCSQTVTNIAHHDICQKLFMLDSDTSLDTEILCTTSPQIRVGTDNSIDMVLSVNKSNLMGFTKTSNDMFSQS